MYRIITSLFPVRVIYALSMISVIARLAVRRRKSFSAEQAVTHMRSVVTPFTLLLVGISLQSATHGASTSTVSIGMVAEVSSRDIATTTSDLAVINYSNSRSEVTVNGIGNPAVLDHSDAAFLPNASVSLYGIGYAEPGSLRAEISGTLAAQSFYQQHAPPGEANHSRDGVVQLRGASVIASNADFLKITDNDHPGAKILFRGFWEVHGTQNVQFSFNGSSAAGITTAATLVAAGGSQVSASAYELNSPVRSGRSNIPSTMPIEAIIVSGAPYAFTTRLTVGATANFIAGINSTVPSAAGSFDNDFSNTILWGGITSVTNADTGEPILNWTITSESGFDYSRPYAVPEPSGAVLLTPLFGVLLGRYIGQRRRIRRAA